MDNSGPTFNPDNFEIIWDELSENEQIQMIQESVHLKPEIAILPVIAGINSYHFSVRNSGKKGLEFIHNILQQKLNNPKQTDDYETGLKQSEIVCNRIYNKVYPELGLNELSYLFKTLIEFGGKGPYYAFKIFYKGIITEKMMIKIINTISDSGRIALVDEYIQTSPQVRLQFATLFKSIASKLKQRDVVINYYTELFDRQIDADPFLQNINSTLRDPDQIIEREITSPSPSIKIKGFKALAMIMTHIPSDFLLNTLLNEEVLKVRLAIYSIIEHSSHNHYAGLYEPLLNLFYKSRKKQEAISIFKAITATGKLPIYSLIEIVKDKRPDILPEIVEEITSFSKISFLVIQDIALHKEQYIKKHYDINMACAFGMVRKRPERIVKILKQHKNQCTDSLKKKITDFIEKTKTLLLKEKKDIEGEFTPYINKITQSRQRPKNFLSSLFATPTEKKLEVLLSNSSSSIIDFECERIDHIDFSSCAYLASPIVFNNCMINGCDFSKTSFFNALCKDTFFYNVDLKDSVFDKTCFDNAVLINVNAQKAKFTSCSFNNAKIFNCNFNQALIHDGSFLNATISKSSFSQADLFCSSFAFSKISAVSFVTANMDHTDFSYAMARFCRFPANSRTQIKDTGINYNNRKHQILLDDLPAMDENIIKDINMMIIGEFIQYGEEKFFKQNNLSLLTAYDIFKEKQAELFMLIPFLLHENTSFPGLEEINKETPCGIYDYVLDKETHFILKKYVNYEYTGIRKKHSINIQGLFTIGSIGSIAQTSDSDIDYWVCINENDFTAQQLMLLTKKLEQLQLMALEKFDTQVTFFLVDILKARNNDFGDSTTESSGSAQSRILKEEFYRTMIHIAGKVPLWSVVPTSIAVHYYNSLAKHVGNISSMSRYIDIGDIHAISTSEYFGASIWQMFKWLKSPFKSVIKMALLEKYIYEYGKESLLCNKYKDEWMNSGSYLNLGHNDSYYILLKNLISYFSKAGDYDSVSLLLTCFFLKLRISKDSQIKNTVFGIRGILLEQCIDKWKWKKEKIFKIGSFKEWPYTEIALLSNTIEKYMVKKYKIVNKAFDSLFRGRSQISPEDRTVLGRKVFIEFSRPPGKVYKVLLISRSDRHFHGLHLQYVKSAKKIGTWALINRRSRCAAVNEDETLINAKTIEEIGAWLINNSLYNKSAVINLIPNPTYVTYDDIRKLFKAMNDFFSSKLKYVASFDQLLQKEQVVRLFISINFYAPKLQNKITEYTVIYLNSWGEMFCRSVYYERGFVNLEQAKNDIMLKLKVDKLPQDTIFYFSKGVIK